VGALALCLIFLLRWGRTRFSPPTIPADGNGSLIQQYSLPLAAPKAFLLLVLPLFFVGTRDWFSVPF